MTTPEANGNGLKGAPWYARLAYRLGTPGLVALVVAGPLLLLGAVGFGVFKLAQLLIESVVTTHAALVETQRSIATTLDELKASLAAHDARLADGIEDREGEAAATLALLTELVGV